MEIVARSDSLDKPGMSKVTELIAIAVESAEKVRAALVEQLAHAASLSPPCS